METSYLILPKNRHIVPLLGLSPDEIKESANNVIRNSGEEIKHSTILNALAKFLGATGGYQGYRKHYQNLCHFMNDHALKHREDLVKARRPCSFQVWLTHQKISERLFLSGKPIPKLLFTGFDYDWVKYDEIQYSEQPQFLITGRHHAFSLQTCANLLGDDLISPEQGDGYIPKKYFAKEVSQSDRLKGIQKDQEMFHEFRTRFMNDSDKGWVEIIPFNQNLIFMILYFVIKGILYLSLLVSILHGKILLYSLMPIFS